MNSGRPGPAVNAIRGYDLYRRGQLVNPQTLRPVSSRAGTRRWQPTFAGYDHFTTTAGTFRLGELIVVPEGESPPVPDDPVAQRLFAWGNNFLRVSTDQGEAAILELTPGGSGVCSRAWMEEQERREPLPNGLHWEEVSLGGPKSGGPELRGFQIKLDGGESA
jgi:hypothetical protein